MRENRPIRVLFCIQNFAGGGAEGVTLTLARGLDHSRFSTTIFAHEMLGSIEPPESTPDVPIIVRNEGYRRSMLPGLFGATLELARQHDVLVGANEGRPTFLGLVAARLLRKPFVAWTHYNMREFSKELTWRGKLSLRASGLANALVSCGGNALPSAVSVTGIKASSALAIPNGIPCKEIRTLAAEPIDPQDEPLFRGQTVLNVGRLAPEKDQSTLIAAHARVRAQGGNQRLLILGRGVMESRLRERASALGVADSVHFIGFRSNPYSYMARSTLMVHSAVTEGFGLVLAEALACGLPVISTDCPSGPREVLSDGRDGILVPVGDVEAMARAMGGVLSQPEEREKWAKRALARGDAHDVRNMAERWGELLERLVHQSPHRLERRTV